MVTERHEAAKYIVDRQQAASSSEQDSQLAQTVDAWNEYSTAQRVGDADRDVILGELQSLSLERLQRIRVSLVAAVPLQELQVMLYSSGSEKDGVPGAIAIEPERTTSEQHKKPSLTREVVLAKVSSAIESIDSLAVLLSVNGARGTSDAAVKELRAMIQSESAISLEEYDMSREQRTRLFQLIGLRFKQTKGPAKMNDLLVVTPMSLVDIRKAAAKGKHDIAAAEKDTLIGVLKVCMEYSENEFQQPAH